MKGSEDARMVASRLGTDERTDAELLAASHGGDASATEALFVRYEGPIYRMALRMCRDPEDAKEVLQETLLAAARTLHDFRGDSAVGTWLYAIARSFCIKLRKRKSRGGGYDATDEEVSAVVDPSALPDDAAAGHEVGIVLQRAIAELSRPYREVLVLRDVEGLTAPEVAAALGIGVDAVKSRLHRARVAVRDKVAPLLQPLAEAPAQSDCPDVLHLFSQRLEGEVDATLCHEMEAHVARCAHCSSACESLKRTLALCTASAPSAPVPPSVQAKVRRALREVIRLEGG